MFKPLRHVCLALAMAGTAVASWTSPHDLKQEEQAPSALIPFPRDVKWKDKEIKLPSDDCWELKGKDINSAPIKTAWKNLLSDVKGKGKDKLTVQLKKAGEKLPEKASKEGYILVVSDKGITIAANEPAGHFYGLQTLRQLVQGRKSIPHCLIKDWPAFRYRGYMQDCGRNFRTIERLKKEIDLAASLKVNLFHWHLTDYPAWHIQCKAYPQLNAAKHRTRDLNDTYSYDQIRELCNYAKARCITIIPELDMPGHSAYFDRAFGFKMHSPEGMKIVSALLDEFCKEIPAELCPIIHFGADEVRIPNAAEFVDMVTKKLEEHGRQPMQWASSRDLPVGEKSIEQRWGEGADMVAKSIRPERITRRAFDSTMGYANLLDPAMAVRRYFFMRPCGVGEGDEQKLGTIFCIWPDGKVDRKEWIPAFCSMWPGMMAMAERSWVGGNADGDALPLEMPAPDTEAGKAYSMFEQRMASLRKSMFKDEDFPVWPESGMTWTVVEPLPQNQAESTRKAVLSGKLDGLKTRPAYCANLYFRTRPDTGYLGMFSGSRAAGNTVWATTTIKVKKAGTYPFMIGFDAPARSNRRWTGVPTAGEWSQTGTRIWINGTEVRNPRVFRNAGKFKHPGNAWNFENPLDIEEIWWALDPVKLQLKKGENTIVIEQPYAGEHHSWGISFIPLFEHK
ncbi:MAG: family 20 glycosylhydrolase [Akkermansia sp.]|nr:family 20 glycosylhydrolase [Akkermansia sp.]